MKTSINSRRLEHSISAETKEEYSYLTSLARAIMKKYNIPEVQCITWHSTMGHMMGIIIYDREYNTIYDSGNIEDDME